MKNGIILLLLAELFFAIGTVIVKIVTSSTSVSAVELAFSRFSTGFVLISSYILYTGKSLKPVKPFNVYMRGFFNCIAVIFFFMGVEYSNVSKANLLNMTYPVFVTILAPVINREKTGGSTILYLGIIMSGIYLVIIPAHSASPFSDINKGDIFAILSALATGFGISFLREAGKSNDFHVIIFYLMGIGTLISGAFTALSFIIPSGRYLLYILFMAVISFTGQIFITTGYKYIDAAPGSLVSSSRIIFAMIFGVVIFSDPLTPRIAAGSIMIIVSLAGISGFFRYLKNKKG
jgi:drug/metabolite transporter (DMT)-like permease